MGISSREFASCAQDFIEGKSIQKYWPSISKEEAIRQIEQWKKRYPPDFFHIPTEFAPMVEEFEKWFIDQLDRLLGSAPPSPSLAR